MATAAFALLAVAAAGFLYRALRGPSIADRVVAIDGLLVIVAAGLATQAGVTGDSWFLDTALVVALLGFVGTSVAARYVERRGG